VHSVVEVRRGDEWIPKYQMVSSPEGPDWAAAEADDFGYPDIALLLVNQGSEWVGEQLLEWPAPASHGDYRVRAEVLVDPASGAAAELPERRQAFSETITIA
jgi:hypothetical protein